MNSSTAANSPAMSSTDNSHAAALQAAQLQQLTAMFSNPLAALLSNASNNGMQPPAASHQPHQPHSFPSTQLNLGLNALTLTSLLGAQQQAQAQAVGGVNFGQLVADAVRLNTPVGTYPDDEELLVNALYESEMQGTTYRRALDGLHGVNSHAANLWKDHYLDHTPRINELVARKRAPLTAKKPSFDSLRRHRTGDHSLGGPSVSHREAERSSHAPSSSRRTSATTLYDASPSKSAVKAKQKEKEKEKPQSKKANTNGAIRVPRRSPTPPDTAIPLKNGYKFSDEDDEYFIKYVNYRLADAPGLSKSDLCAELAAKCPYHSANSWMSHWSYRRELYDSQIPQFAKGLVPGRDHDSDNASSDGGGEDYDMDGEGYGSDNDKEAPVKRKRGGKGLSVTEGDLTKMAEYIESIGREWEDLKSRERWEPFQLQYPHRSWPAWAETYRKYKTDIEEMIADSKRRHASVHEQRAVPAWARDRAASFRQKRSHSTDVEDDGEVERELKRQKDD